MAPSDLETCLTRTVLFSGLDPDSIGEIAKAATVKRYLPDDRVLVEGHDSYHGGMGVVLRGQLAVVRESDRQVLNHIGPGESFGEMSLIDDEPRSATVIAEEVSEVATLSRGAFRAVIREHPDVALRLLSVMNDRIRKATANGPPA
jgi:CRP/FNR family transcriptional regulator, cyclic AMP receptor protein